MEVLVLAAAVLVVAALSVPLPPAPPAAVLAWAGESAMVAAARDFHADESAIDLGTPRAVGAWSDAYLHGGDGAAVDYRTEHWFSTVSVDGHPVGVVIAEYVPATDVAFLSSSGGLGEAAFAQQLVAHPYAAVVNSEVVSDVALIAGDRVIDADGTTSSVSGHRDVIARRLAENEAAVPHEPDPGFVAVILLALASTGVGVAAAVRGARNERRAAGAR